MSQSLPNRAVLQSCAALALCIAFCPAARGQLLAAVAAAPLPEAPLPVSASISNDTTAAAAHTPTPVQPQAQQPQTDADRRAQAQQQIKQQESQRMLGIVPAFNEVIGGKAVPLAPAQKFSLFFHGSIDPYQFAIAGVDAGIEQGQNSYPEWHQGVAGYSKRYAAAFADNFDGNFWGNAVLPSLLHQDPRYFRLGHGNPLHRMLYAVSMTVICKGDDGRWQMNVSNVTGNLIGGAISNAYYPASDRGFGLTLDRGFTTTAEGALGSLALEFYPDLAEWMRRRQERKAAALAAAASSTP